MFCEVCKKKIYVRKHIFNLFLKQTHHICEYCFKKYPLLIKRSIIPIDGGEILWTSLIQTKDSISPLAHMSFYKPFYVEYINHYKNRLIMIETSINDEKMDLYENLKLGDMYLLTLYDIIEKKESYYEI